MKINEWNRKEYVEALDGVEKLKHIIVLYWGDKADRTVPSQLHLVQL